LGTRRTDRLAIGKGKLDLSMSGSRLTARNPFAPFGIHVLQVQIVRLENVHITVEDLVSVLRHALNLRNENAPMSNHSQTAPSA
jgi:hypothetical protein